MASDYDRDMMKKLSAEVGELAGKQRNAQNARDRMAEATLYALQLLVIACGKRSDSEIFKAISMAEHAKDEMLAATGRLPGSATSGQTERERLQAECDEAARRGRVAPMSPVAGAGDGSAGQASGALGALEPTGGGYARKGAPGYPCAWPPEVTLASDGDVLSLGKKVRKCRLVVNGMTVEHYVEGSPAVGYAADGVFDALVLMRVKAYKDAFGR